MYIAWCLFSDFFTNTVLTCYHTIPTFNKAFEKVGKGENAGKQDFLLFPQCFFILVETNFNFLVTFILSSANPFNLV